MKHLRYLILTALLLGCAGTARSCSATWAERAGANWVVVQYDAFGRPFRCWALQGVSIANESGSDGIYWEGPDGNLVHITNSYNRVQVSSRRWAEAYTSLGITEERCRAMMSVSLPEHGPVSIPTTTIDNQPAPSR